MKRKKLAWALIFLGIGAFIGLGFGRSTSRLGIINRGVDRIERIVIQDDIQSEIIEEIVVDIPPIPTIPPIPSFRTAPEIVIEHGPPSIGILSLVGNLIRGASNLLALLIIVTGVVLILRQRNQPIEKTPANVMPKTE